MLWKCSCPILCAGDQVQLSSHPNSLVSARRRCCCCCCCGSSSLLRKEQSSGLLVSVWPARSTTAGNIGQAFCTRTAFARCASVHILQTAYERSNWCNTWPPGGGGVGGVSPHTSLPPLTAVAGSTGKPPGMAPHSVGFPGFSTLQHKARRQSSRSAGGCMYRLEVRVQRAATDRRWKQPSPMPTVVEEAMPSFTKHMPWSVSNSV